MLRRLCMGRATAILLAAAILSGCLTPRHRGHFLNTDGVRLFYTVQGRGEPVILVHGFAVNTDLNWRLPGVIRALAKDYEVIAFDNRGHGRSDKPHDPALYGQQMVDDVLRMMDHLGIQRAHVIGYSLGGFITIKLMTQHPERLVSAIPCAAGWERHDIGDHQVRLDAMIEGMDRGDFAPMLREVGLQNKGFGKIKVAMVSSFFRRINDTEALAAVLRALPELEVTEAELRANTVPVLSVAGSRDTLKKGIDAMTGILACHHVIIIKGGDHNSTLAHRAYIRALREFLRQHSAVAYPAESGKKHRRRSKNGGRL